jgi:hypothetical protein
MSLITQQDGFPAFPTNQGQTNPPPSGNRGLVKEFTLNDMGLSGTAPWVHGLKSVNLDLTAYHVTPNLTEAIDIDWWILNDDTIEIRLEDHYPFPGNIKIVLDKVV